MDEKLKRFFQLNACLQILKTYSMLHKWEFSGVFAEFAGMLTQEDLILLAQSKGIIDSLDESFCFAIDCKYFGRNGSGVADFLIRKINQKEETNG